MKKRYGNLHGNSGVISYETGKNYINVTFHGNETYVYNEIKPGKLKVEKMKELAATGSGLSTYISQHVREDYYKKLK